jgi:tRNA-2-methylthio-N6-dimethylallyladenosine synthase
MRQVEFDGVFAFMYSDRPNTPARHLPEKIPNREMRERLQAVLALQGRITHAKHLALVGSAQAVLTEGFSKRPASAAASDRRTPWTGRTPGNKIVHFFDEVPLAAAAPLCPGRLVRVRIERALAHSLWGSLERATVSGTP